MYLLNFYFLLTAIGVCLFGRVLGKNYTILLNLIFLFLSVVLNILVFYETVLGSVVEVKLFQWITVGDLSVNIVFLYDFLSASMLLLVTFISFAVHFYSWGYMSHDPSKVRFFCYLSLFTFFMGLLVVSEGLVQLFFAWEGVGITSYLLINFWYTRYEANRAALKAVFVNRFGDFGLYTGIILMLVYFKTQSIPTINALAQEWRGEYDLTLDFLGQNYDLLSFISFFIFLGVVGKSAQLGLHTWLPDAMEGPTPVSALLHAATMVTAGVYVVLRLSFFFQVSNLMLLFAFWGALTAFVASTIGAFQNDIKKIIAYSTCSQLGYMLASCGLFNFAGAYFHLFNHAFFKALLFLGAGSVIHSIGDEQDLRKYGGLVKLLPFTHLCLLLASFSLMGLPFFSGFYSKDILINWAYTEYALMSRVVYFFLLGAAFFTAFYSFKILYYTFYSSPRCSLNQFKNVKESDFWIKIPMFVLSIFALMSGYFFFDLFMGYGTTLAGLPVKLEANYLVSLEFLPQLRKFLPLFVVLVSGCIFVVVTRYYLLVFITGLFNWSKLVYIFVRLQTFFNKKWFFDYIYFYLVKGVLSMSYHVLFKNFDKGLFETVFVKKLIWSVLSFGNKLRFLQSGMLSNYTISIVTISLFLLVCFILMFCESFALLALFIFYSLYQLWRKF